jgi:hypothetical protein
MILANELLKGPGSHSVSKGSFPLKQFLFVLLKKAGLFFQILLPFIKITSTKFQAPNKLQDSMTKNNPHWNLGYWLLFGDRCLVIGDLYDPPL